MSNFIEDLSIYNFKSIKELHLKPKRVNVFIGRPNVGKSNVLEALSLFSLPYVAYDRDLKLQDVIRLDKVSNIFHFNNIENSIAVKTNIGSVIFTPDVNSSDFKIFLGSKKFNVPENLQYFHVNSVIDDYLEEIVSKSNAADFFKEDYASEWSSTVSINGDITNKEGGYDYYSPIKVYNYNGSFVRKNQDLIYSPSLLPPFGNNLLSILSRQKKLVSEFSDLFSEYGYGLLYHHEEKKFYVLRKEDGVFYTLPLSVIADTLLRFIFHITMIRTNKNSVLLLEEPESHSYPPYITMLANEIIEDEKNQYFIATHSPYLLDILMDNDKKDEVGVFLVYYKGYETKVRELTLEEKTENVRYGGDLFMALDQYEHE